MISDLYSHVIPQSVCHIAAFVSRGCFPEFKCFDPTTYVKSKGLATDVYRPNNNNKKTQRHTIYRQPKESQLVLSLVSVFIR